MKIEFSKEAEAKVLSYMEAQQEKEGQLLRIRVGAPGMGGLSYQFFLDHEKEKAADDVIENMGNFRLVADVQSAEALDGATVDWIENASGAGFKVTNPNDKTGPDLSHPLAKKIQDLFDQEINPSLGSHGGFVQLIKVDDDKAFVRMGGGCHGCGMANVTLKQGVEVRIREVVPEIKEVIDVTDHAGGENPYYRS